MFKMVSRLKSNTIVTWIPSFFFFFFSTWDNTPAAWIMPQRQSKLETFHFQHVCYKCPNFVKTQKRFCIVLQSWFFMTFGRGDNLARLQNLYGYFLKDASVAYRKDAIVALIVSYDLWALYWSSLLAVSQLNIMFPTQYRKELNIRSKYSSDRSVTCSHIINGVAWKKQMNQVFISIWVRFLY